LPANAADIITAGWAIGHMTSWFEERWQQKISNVINEMRRVVQSGGVLIIIETLGTGFVKPAPPGDNLAKYYAWLKSELGFSEEIISTDYQFEDVSTAVDAMSFFFGPELGEKIRQNNWSRVPEWTGIWYLKI